MGILVKKRHGFYHLTRIGGLSILGLIIGLASASINTIWAVYLNGFVNNAAMVGLIASFLTLVSFFSYFFFIPLIEKSSKKKLFSISLVLIFFFYILFSFINNFYFFLLLAVLMVITYTLRITSFGLIIRDNSKKQNLSKNEGVVYSLANTAWVIGPLIAGFVASRFGEKRVFLLAAVFLFIGFFFFKSIKVQKCGKQKPDKDIINNFIDFFRDRERIIAYVLGGGVNLWWTLIYLFIPLLIINSHLGDLWVGYFLFAIAVPLLLFETFFSNMAGKKGFKKIFKIGYLAVAILAFVCFIFSSIYIILILLVLASVGMAMLEPTTEAYFFDISSKKEEYRFYGPYNTAIDSLGFIGRISASLVLLIFPFKFLFILFGVFMFLLFLLSFKTKGIIEQRRQ